MRRNILFRCTFFQRFLVEKNLRSAPDGPAIAPWITERISCKEESRQGQHEDAETEGEEDPIMTYTDKWTWPWTHTKQQSNSLIMYVDQRWSCMPVLTLVRPWLHKITVSQEVSCGASNNPHTMDGPERPRGPGFESDLQSFPDPTSNHSPGRFLSLFTVLSN